MEPADITAEASEEPRAQPTADSGDSVDQAIAWAKQPLAGMTVLIVDRIRHSRSVLRKLVTDLGAEQVIDAVDIDETALTLRMQAVHLVVCEYLLEDGTTAQQLLETLRAENLLPLATMVVVVAGERSSRCVASVAEFGPDAYLIKPLVTEEVRLRMARVSCRRRLMYELHAALAGDEIEAAIAEAQRLAQLHPALLSEAFRLVSSLLIEQGRIDAAEQLVKEALAKKAFPWALHLLAQIRVRQFRFDDAERLLKTLITRHPDHLAAYDLMAKIMESRGLHADALECLDEVSGRALPTLSRLRRTGALARQVGDLGRAETALMQVMQRTSRAALGSSEDYSNLLQVLVARGKVELAERISTEQGKRLAGHPDAIVVHGMLQFSKMRGRGDRVASQLAMNELVESIENGIAAMSVPLGVQALEACVEDSFRDEGYRVGASLVRSKRVDRPTLHRIRQLIDQLSKTPENLLSIDEIPMTLERLQVEGWDHKLGPKVAESIDYWHRQIPDDAALVASRARLTLLARHYGIAQLQ